MKEYNYDVAVLGAGTAGAAAAIAAADSGARVIVVEQFGSAGGSGSLGLVTPLMSTHIKGNPQCSYVGKEITERLRRENAADGSKCFFDPLMLSLVLEEMLDERGVKMLYHTMITGVDVQCGSIAGIHAFNVSGEALIKAKRYIDCTGDAVVCDLAGFTTLHGDEQNGRNQPCSLRYVTGGVDTDRFWDFLAEKRGNTGAHREGNYTGAVTLNQGAPRALDGVFRAALENGDLSEDDCAYWQFFTLPGRSDAIAFNCPEFFGIDDIADADSQSFVEVQGKKRILRQLRFCRKYLPGFENAYVAQISAMVGIRESRRADTEYILTVDDAYSWRKFEDGIVQTNYPVDVHGRVLNYRQFERDENEPRKYFEVPFRSLVVKGADNLLVAGRNLGAEFVAQSAVRIIPTCRALGEAAGIAAGTGLTDGRLIRAEMIRRGAEFSD